LGEAREHGDDPAWYGAEAAMLYERLEREVIPEFYSRDTGGIPSAWVKRMRQSMASLTPRFSADRAVREYTEKYYLPAAAAYRLRAADKGSLGRAITFWRQSLEQNWGTLHFGYLKVESCNEQHFFEVQLFLGGLDPDAVRVELFADGIAESPPTRVEMRPVPQPGGTPGYYVYDAAVAANRTATDYRARVIPFFPGVAIPLEDSHILWQQ
jgi:starch phosphorylase